MNSVIVQTDSASRLTKGYVICVCATVSWAFTAIFISYLSVNYALPALVLALWRDVIVASAFTLGYLILSPQRLRMERKHLGFLVLYGLVLAVFNTLWTYSVAFNGAAVSTVLAYSSAAYTALLAWRLLGEPLSRVKVLAVVLGLSGCALVAGAYNPQAWQVNPFGILTGIFSGLAFAAYSLMGKFASNRAVHTSTALTYSFAFAAAFLLIFNVAASLTPGGAPLSDLFWLGSSLSGWGVLVLLAIGPTIGGYGLYTLSLTYLPASVANLIAMMEPAITAALAYALLGERMNTPQIIGGVMIISCVVIVRAFDKLT